MHGGVGTVTISLKRYPSLPVVGCKGCRSGPGVVRDSYPWLGPTVKSISIMMCKLFHVGVRYEISCEVGEGTLSIKRVLVLGFALFGLVCGTNYLVLSSYCFLFCRRKSREDSLTGLGGHFWNCS